MSCTLRIDNLDVYCGDIPRMYHFYHEVLGAALLYPYSTDDAWFAIQSGDVSVYFLDGDGPDDTAAHPPAGNTRGIASFSFEVADLDAAIRELDGEVEWIEPVSRWEHPDGTWYRFRFFTDPEGNVLSITEPHKAKHS